MDIEEMARRLVESGLVRNDEVVINPAKITCKMVKDNLAVMVVTRTRSVLF